MSSRLTQLLEWLVVTQHSFGCWSTFSLMDMKISSSQTHLSKKYIRVLLKVQIKMRLVTRMLQISCSFRLWQRTSLPGISIMISNWHLLSVSSVAAIRTKIGISSDLKGTIYFRRIRNDSSKSSACIISLVSWGWRISWPNWWVLRTIRSFLSISHVNTKLRTSRNQIVSKMLKYMMMKSICRLTTTWIKRLNLTLSYSFPIY